MKNLFLLLPLLLIISCQKELEPSIPNINSIFDTQDFNIRFMMKNGTEYRMGFLNNEIAFFSPQETLRRELSYDDVVLINTFVGDRFRTSAALSMNSSEKAHNNAGQIEIYNDSKKVVFSSPDYSAGFEQLLIKLKLPYVSTKKK
ncbi:hypothetical protein [Nonlabens antarcticus]|uniref:hypothetical protein n=1 Tax=Nonlabens antarcticus TaxID=392714 RepID=UPI001891D3C6|nr:hypothetical protein [Nonlabens antarcticus]